MDAYQTAMQLELPNLASAALDAAQSVPGSQGHWARAVEYSRIREELLPDLTDLDEVGDVAACAAWNHYEVGLYRTSERWASEGNSAVPRVGRSRSDSIRTPGGAWPGSGWAIGTRRCRTIRRSVINSMNAGMNRRTSLPTRTEQPC